MSEKISAHLGDKQIIIETGKLAKQADGSVTVQLGETIVMVAAVAAVKAKEGQDFFPLTVDYREKAAAAGKFPGASLILPSARSFPRAGITKSRCRVSS